MMVAAFFRWLSRTPGQQAASQLRRRRTFMLLHLGLLLALVPIGGVLYFFGDGELSPLRYFWGQVLVVAITPLLLRCTTKIDQLTLFSVVWMDFLIFSTAYNYGGLSAPILAAIILIPVAAYVHLRPTGRLLALAGLAIGIAILTFLEVTGHAFPQHLDPTGERLLSAVTLLALAGFAVMLGNQALAERSDNRALVRDAARSRRISERDSAEARRITEERARRKTAYLASFGNDMGAPLRAMVGFSQIISRDLLDQGTPDSYRGYAQDIESSGRKLLQVVHAIEDLARHEAGDLELAIEGVDLREIVRNVVADLKQLAEVRGISINTEYRTDDVVVAGDPKRLAQMIHHLVANAIQHEINGGRANIVLGDCDKDHVTIRITNPGTAIAEETLTRLHHLFAPDATEPALSPGQGVGLPLVATLLRLHQGTVDIDSNDEIGTSVRLRLPRLTTTIETETNDARSTFA